MGLLSSVHAQAVVPDSTVSYQDAIIQATINRIDKLHYHPRALDSTYSARVWSNYLNQLDPEHSLFMQADITTFTPYKYIIGRELMQGSSKFFNVVYAVYYKRIKEAENVFKNIISRPITFNEQTTFTVNRKKLPFPNSNERRAEVWKQVIKYAVLKHYMEADSTGSSLTKKQLGLDPALKAASIDFVNKWYSDYFRNAILGSAISNKFALYLNTAVSEIDPHTAYVAPRDKSFEALITKRFYGIGVELGQKGVDLYIKRVMQGGPAYKSGQILENDVIVAVANQKGELQPISGMAPTQVANMIRGEKGTSISLQVAQPGESPRTVNLQRGEVIDTHNKAKSAIIDINGQKLGYVYLPLFYLDPKNDGKGGAGFDVAMEVMKLQENQVDGIIVDLRNNLGGSLPDVVKMCGTFLPPEPAVTYLKDKDTLSGMGFTQNGLVYYTGPLVVLVNENTASASEIFSAAMQDFHRAIIVGTTSTFGKGTAQTVLNMGKLGDPEKGIQNINYGSMRLTEKKFYRVTGVSTQLAGVKPDIVLIDEMLINAPREKNYYSALKSDSIKLPNYTPLKNNYNYKYVVANAEKRISQNPAFNIITRDLKSIGELSKLPQSLNAATFKTQYLKLKAINDKFKKDNQLPQNEYLTIQGAQYQSIRPDQFKPDPRDAKDYQTWIDGLSKDVYLKETVNVLLDVIKSSNH
ncbi:carboxy terminal-processing peptidase [Arachidicoccus ginsenosidivorans]